MAAVFPFNKISTIPLTVLSALLPAFLKQKESLNNVIGNLQQKISGLSKTASCNDSEISSIKQDLDQIKKLVENIQQLSNLLQPISSGLQTASTIANILIPIQLAIPAVVGVPDGPKEQLLIALADLLQNITVVLNMLNTIVSNINQLNTTVSNVVSDTQEKINSICNDAESNNNPTNQDALSDPELNLEYPSEFYREINVSDEDLQNRIDQIQSLLDEQLNVLDNLIEAPSTVLRGNGLPNNELGKIGDYYIDTNTQTVYGPKSTQNSWS